MDKNRLRGIPDSPFPGLRPFSHDEANMFFGRDRQINEIVSRLERNKIVTVLGSSGSGKSSLVKAGVIPRLRQYGIKQAGHFWMPVVFTPGTNFKYLDEGPYYNLAHALFNTIDVGKYKQAIGDDSADLDNKLLYDIKNIIYSPDGLTDFIDRYHPYLAAESGVLRNAVNYLFVFDQFEEVFHSSNSNRNDINEFIEGLLVGHYKRPHDRAYVIITMRSEYLDDCARFIHLPDIINNSGYLVGRLKPFEIVEVIESPPKRYLRILKRYQDEIDGRLTDDITVDSEVVRILLNEVKRLHKEPDYLPLLQHLLYRLWQVSVERARDFGYLVPAEITADDLQVATGQKGKAHASGMRIFESCLDHWANHCYDRLRENNIDADTIQHFFTRLAYIDHNKKYTQQRVHLEEFKDDSGLDTSDVKMIVDVFSQPHSYLHHEKEKQSVKVSHESFIRCWEKFRGWIDQEAADIKEYLSIYDKYKYWKSSGNKNQDLLKKRDLAHLKITKLDRRIADSRVEGLIQNKILQSADDEQIIADFKDKKLSLVDFFNRSVRHKRYRRIGSSVVVVGSVLLLFLLPWLWNLYNTNRFNTIYFDYSQSIKKMGPGSFKNISKVSTHEDLFSLVEDSFQFQQLSHEVENSFISVLLSMISISDPYEQKRIEAQERVRAHLRDNLVEKTEHSNYFVHNPVNNPGRSDQSGPDVEPNVNCSSVRRDGSQASYDDGTLITVARGPLTDTGLQPALYIRKSLSIAGPAEKPGRQQQAASRQFLGRNQGTGFQSAEQREQNFRRGEYKFQIFSAVLSEGNCHLVGLPNYLEYLTSQTVDNVFGIYFASNLSSGYLVTRYDTDQPQAFPKIALSQFMIQQLPPGDEQISDSVNQLPVRISDNQNDLLYYIPNIDLKSRLLIDLQDVGDTRLLDNLIENNYLFYESTRDLHGGTQAFGDVIIRNTTYSTPAKYKPDFDSDDWHALREVNNTHDGHICGEWKQSALSEFEFFEDDFSNARHFELADDSDRKICLIVVDKSNLLSFPSWNIYILDEDLIEQNSSVPVIRRFYPNTAGPAENADTGSLTMYIGKGANEGWLGVSSSAPASMPEIIKPWSYTAIHRHIDQLCDEVTPDGCPF